MSSAAFLARFGSGSGYNGEPDPEEESLTTPTGDCGASAFISRFAGVSESYFFYGNTIEIKFDSVEHKYYRVGELGELIPLLNVSTVSKIVDRSPALIPWAAKVTVEKLLRTIPTMQVPGPDPEHQLMVPGMTFSEFSKLAMAAKSAHSDKLEDAGDVGHMAHDFLEHYIKALMADDQAAIQGMMTQMCSDPRATNCVLAALDWMKAHNVRWLESERKVFSKELDCSGTLDGLCITDSCTNPSCCATPFKDRRTLLDWKTSNYLYIEFIYQASAYKAFYLEEFPNEVITDIWILRLGKEDGEFQPWHLKEEDFETDFAGFRACLHLKRKVLELEERMKEQKRIIREAKKVQRAIDKEARKVAEKQRKQDERAQKKAERTAEKERVKAEAKAERERLKAAKKAAKENPECTSSLNESTEKENTTKLGSGTQTELGIQSSDSTPPILSEPKVMQESLSTISTVATEVRGCDPQVEVEQTVNLPLQVSIAGSIPATPTIQEEDEDVRPVFQIPTED